MSEDRPSSTDEGRPRSWLERIGQALSPEPRDREELLQVLHDAGQRDLLDSDALKMIDGVMAVAEMQARDIMIPRSQMVVIEREASLEDILPRVIESAHSRYPVIGENRDVVEGIMLAKDLLPFSTGGEPFDMREVLRPAVFIPESKRLNVLLTEFRTTRNHMAIVVDEYGGVAGLITIEDVLEQIVGKIEDEHDIEGEKGGILSLGSNRHEVPALTPIDEFNDYFSADLSDEEFDTVGGLVMNAFGRLPEMGEAVGIGGFTFYVTEADKRRIHLLEVEPRAVSVDDVPGDDAPLH